MGEKKKKKKLRTIINNNLNPHFRLGHEFRTLASVVGDKGSNYCTKSVPIITRTAGCGTESIELHFFLFSYYYILAMMYK